MADQTVAQTIDSCREHLLGNARSEMNELFVAGQTTVASGSNNSSVPASSEVFVASTTTLAASGVVSINGGIVTYTGLGSGLLTGCTGSCPTMHTGDAVVPGIQGGDKVLTFSYPLGSINRGGYISIDDEEMYVYGVSAGNPSSATVARGENSSAITWHFSGARVYVNEPFNRNMILNAIIDDIRSWGPQVYQVKTESLTLIPYVLGYDLGAITPFYNVIDARATPPPTYNIPDNNDWKRVRFIVEKSAPTSDFASGNALIIKGQGGMGGGSVMDFYNYVGYTPTVWLRYTAPFNVDTIVTNGEQANLVADVGLSETALDIPAIGAAWRLLFMREARRTLTRMQGDPRDASEVPPLFISHTAEMFKQVRDGRLWDEQTRLMSEYPWTTVN